MKFVDWPYAFRILKPIPSMYGIFTCNLVDVYGKCRQILPDTSPMDLMGYRPLGNKQETEHEIDAAFPVWDFEHFLPGTLKPLNPSTVNKVHQI